MFGNLPSGHQGISHYRARTPLSNPVTYLYLLDETPPTFIMRCIKYNTKEKHKRCKQREKAYNLRFMPVC